MLWRNVILLCGLLSTIHAQLPNVDPSLPLSLTEPGTTLPETIISTSLSDLVSPSIIPPASTPSTSPLTTQQQDSTVVSPPSSSSDVSTSQNSSPIPAIATVTITESQSPSNPTFIPSFPTTPIPSTISTDSPLSSIIHTTTLNPDPGVSASVAVGSGNTAPSWSTTIYPTIAITHPPLPSSTDEITGGMEGGNGNRPGLVTNSSGGKGGMPSGGVLDSSALKRNSEFFGGGGMAVGLGLGLVLGLGMELVGSIVM